MSTFPNATEPESVDLSNESVDDAFDTSLPFDSWLQDLQDGQKHPAAVTDAAEEESSEIYIGSFPGSNCEVSFEGTLHFDGYSIGNISSPDGTLVLTKRGRIEADINVGVAIIFGSVTGNITATERVVLESEARVSGQIRTRALSVRLGAVFDGDCVFIGLPETTGCKESLEQKQSEELNELAVGAAV